MEGLADTISWALVVFQLVLAAILVVFGRNSMYPPAAYALAIFFIVRVAGRLCVRVLGWDSPAQLMAIDVALLLSTLFLLYTLYCGVRQLRERMEREREEREWAEDEATLHSRARTEYERLLRHRLANPLSVIFGMSETLLHHRSLPKDVWVELLEQINQQAKVLNDICLSEYPMDHIEARSIDARVTQTGGGNVSVQGDVAGSVEMGSSKPGPRGVRGRRGRRGRKGHSGHEGKTGKMGKTGPAGEDK